MKVFLFLLLTFRILHSTWNYYYFEFMLKLIINCFMEWLLIFFLQTAYLLILLYIIFIAISIHIELQFVWKNKEKYWTEKWINNFSSLFFLSNFIFTLTLINFIWALNFYFIYLITVNFSMFIYYCLNCLQKIFNSFNETCYGKNISK